MLFVLVSFRCEMDLPAYRFLLRKIIGVTAVVRGLAPAKLLYGDFAPQAVFAFTCHSQRLEKEEKGLCNHFKC